ncbi:di-glucose binding protein with Kinesin motor domain-containing protein isoform X2 [Tasmannia lanceolata]|uniref:di-glucose binding protein with Kinesin motor domain-containing protein isoform X2 n=1 Tax=Tasmannia lanceolata TaxID=3420 RepID=UPI00406376FC
METNPPNSSHQDQETLVQEPYFPKFSDRENDLHKISSPFLKENRISCGRDDDDGVSIDSTLCIPGSKLVPLGFKQSNCTEELVMLVNAGGGPVSGLSDSMNFKTDFGFQDGDVLRTNESILNGEIVNTQGPKGMRVFNVFIQEEKVLSELDIYSVVGANNPLQMVDARVSVAENSGLVIRFEGIHGSPVVCGIGIRKAPNLSAHLAKSEYLVCNNCATRIQVSSTQNGARSTKDLERYEKKIDDLTSQCKLKADECYEAWLSFTEANDKLEKLKMELDNKYFQTESLDRTVEKQAGQLRDVSDRYERDKKCWVAAVNDLEGKIKVMKQEHSQLSREAHDCADSIPQLNKMIFAVQALVAQCEELKIKYNEEMVKRKKLYNQVQETKGNIRVFCRCRPLSKEEALSGCATIADFEAAKDGDLGILTGGGSTKKTFKFDRVYTPKDNQVDVFGDASPMVVSVLDGYNVCIFAYGQTGTGKTFTMEGTEQNRGVNYRTLEELFKIANDRREAFDYNISVSVLEVYNEQIRDLLATSPSSKKLEIRQVSEGAHHVPGIVEAKVESIKEVWEVLKAGSNARAVGSNNVNEHSSRSHCMLSIMVRGKNLMSGECTNSKLWLVDLAGSERLAKTDVQGERLKEAQNINRSLSALGNVISALAAKNSHIPYRNSKLTHLLQDSLGGDSKTLMFVQISPSEHDLGETLSSLNFATRVRGIELGPAKKQIDTGELQKIKQMLDKTRQECRLKDEALRKIEENYQNLESKLRGKDQLSRNHHEKVKELEAQLESKTELQSQLERQLCQISEKLKGRDEMCMTLQQKVKEQQSESMTHQLKIKELENKLREQHVTQIKELENKLREQHHSESMILRQKVKELENKVKEQQHSESAILQQKVKELENKLKEREQQSESILLLLSADKSRDTPNDRKTLPIDDSTAEYDPQILRSSNSINRPTNQTSVLLRGSDSLHEIRRKREIRSGVVGESENNTNNIIPAKVVPSEFNRHRQIDSTKAFGRITRTSKAVTTTQKVFPYNRINRDQVASIKERDKTRGWSR